jgi:uncharacterized protein YlbG (UPF0298 family)
VPEAFVKSSKKIETTTYVHVHTYICMYINASEVSAIRLATYVCIKSIQVFSFASIKNSMIVFKNVNIFKKRTREMGVFSTQW